MKQRSSNFELLRIIAMLMIIGHHLFIHGLIHILEPVKYIAFRQGFASNKFLASLYYPGGDVGVAIFFLITGYFAVAGGEKIRWRAIEKLVCATVFYSLLLGGLAIIAFKFGYITPAITTQLEKLSAFIGAMLIPVSGANYWFVTVYLMLMFMAPVLNKGLLLLNKRGFRLALFFVWVFTYLLNAMVGSKFINIYKGIFFYMFGFYIKRFYEEIKIRRFICILLALLGWGLYSYVVATAFDTIQSDKLFSEIIRVYGQPFAMGLLVPAIAVSLFLLFSRLDIGTKGFINGIASTCFGVYLLHDFAIFRQGIWNYIFKVDSLQFNSPYFVFTSLATVLILFIVLSLIDMARIKILQPIYLKAVDKLFAFLRRKYLADETRA
ncbi:MAG: acyltransferase [Pseudobutyrivibrio sp.]|nr:acyltransferase [Pseudobutyrivibrio sp.]